MDLARTPRQKAHEIIRDGTRFGTFAEIGAGQDVVGRFFAVGGASSTLAKSISAYDTTFSDDIYGEADHYVSRSRLIAMLDYEYKQLIDRLDQKRGGQTRFFVIADTAATHTRAHQSGGHGWMGVRFQTEPRSPPSEVILHVQLLESVTDHEQDAIGILGVNLMHAAFYDFQHPERIIGALPDNLDHGRIEVDVIRFSGPAFTGVDNRLMSLQLIRQGLTHAALFSATGEVMQPSEVLAGKRVLMERGSFWPVTNVTLDMLDRAEAQLRQEMGAQLRQEMGAQLRPGTGGQLRPETGPQLRPETAAQLRPEMGAQLRPETGAQLRPETGAQFRPETGAQLRPETGAQPGEKAGAPNGGCVVLMEVSLNNLITPGGTGGEKDAIDNRDFLDRADTLGALGKMVMISDYARFDELIGYLRQYTREWIVMPVGMPVLREIMDKKYYAALDGGILEGVGRLFRGPVKLYVYPMKTAPDAPVLSLESFDPPPHLAHLYAYLTENGLIVAMREFAEAQLHISPSEVRRRIDSGDPEWERMVPPVVAGLIKQRGLFGYRANPR